MGSFVAVASSIDWPRQPERRLPLASRSSYGTLAPLSHNDGEIVAIVICVYASLKSLQFTAGGRLTELTITRKSLRSLLPYPL